MKNKTLIQSFKNAFNGFYQALRSERNLWIHMSALALVLAIGAILKVDVLRWALLFCAVGFVLVTELLNTAVEKLTDMVTTEYSEQARRVKDISAAAVLVGAIIAVIIGIFVFCQPVMALLGWTSL